MAGPDMSVLVAAATDWSGEIAAVLSVAAGLIIYYVAAKAAQFVLQVVRDRNGYWSDYTEEDNQRDRKAAGLE